MSTPTLPDGSGQVKRETAPLAVALETIERACRREEAIVTEKVKALARLLERKASWQVRRGTGHRSAGDRDAEMLRLAHEGGPW